MAKKTLYIAYGSNINLSQMAYRCPTAERVSTGFVENYELEFRRVATIVPKQDSKVPVLVWELKPEDEKNLDRYGGFPHMYRKETIPVKVGDEVVDGMVYIMNDGQVTPPPESYYAGIMEGYLANNMDTSYLRSAAERSYSHYLSDLQKRCVDCSETEDYDLDEDEDEDYDFDEDEDEDEDYDEDYDYDEDEDESIDPDIDGQLTIDHRSLRM